MEWYWYEKNEEFPYFPQEERALRTALAKPLLVEKGKWMLFLLIATVYMGSKEITLTDGLGRGILLLITIFLGSSLISLISKTIEVKRQGISNTESQQMIWNKFLLKKWSYWCFQLVLSYSLLFYAVGNRIWAWGVIFAIVLRMAWLGFRLMIQHLRLAMIKECINETKEEVIKHRRLWAQGALQEFLSGGNDTEFVLGTSGMVLLRVIKDSFLHAEKVAKREKGAVKEASQLVINLSHDLNTPLTSLMNGAYTLQNEELTALEREEQLMIMKSKAKRMEQLLIQLKEVMMKQADSGQVESMVWQELIEQRIEEFQLAFQEKQIDMVTNFPSEAVNVRGNREHMVRVLENLFSNMEKYSLEETRIYIDLEQDEEEGVAKLTFRNIIKDEIEVDPTTIGQRFVKGNKARQGDGPGLGLSIVRALMESQGYDMEIEVDGDLFKVTLTS